MGAQERLGRGLYPTLRSPSVGLVRVTRHYGISHLEGEEAERVEAGLENEIDRREQSGVAGPVRFARVMFRIEAVDPKNIDSSLRP